MHSSRTRVERVRKAFVEQGLEGALNRKPRTRPGNQKFEGRHQAQLSALACAPAPEGRSRWTLQLLADHMVQLDYTESIQGTVSGPAAGRGATAALGLYL